MVLMVQHSPPGKPIRSGTSLLEVLAALTIFLFSLVAISRLIEIGVDQAVEMDLRGQAVMLAQTKLAEVVAGATSLNGVGESELDDEPGWKWSMTVEQDTAPSLYKVQVKVMRDHPSGPIEVTLSQYVLDPQKRGSSDATAIGTDQTGTTTNSTNGTTGNP